jgi:hypothetical protein
MNSPQQMSLENSAYFNKKSAHFECAMPATAQVEGAAITLFAAL